MSGHRRRVRTLQALVGSIPCVALHPSGTAIQVEFSEVHRARRVRKAERRRLLEVLHSTRALDSTLSVFVSHHGCSTGGRSARSLGAYLRALESHAVPTLGRLPSALRWHFQSTIADPRNKYMHEAGAAPATDGDLVALLSEMHSCLAAVARL